MALVGNQPLPGLQPVGSGMGGTSPRVREYSVAAAYTTDIGEGNILIKTATGVQLLANAGAVGGIIVGVAAQNHTADELALIQVYDDPAQEFAIILDGTATTTVQIEAIGQFTRLTTDTNVINTTLGQGASTLDISAIVGTRTATTILQVVANPKIVGDTLATTQAGNVGQMIVKIVDAFHIWSSNSVTRAT